MILTRLVWSRHSLLRVRAILVLQRQNLTRLPWSRNCLLISPVRLEH